MTSPIGPISAVSGVGGVGGVGGIGQAGGVGGISPIDQIDTTINGPVAPGPVGGGEDFASKLAEGLESVQELQKTTDDLRVKAATGNLTDVHDYQIAAAESGIATSLTVAIRNKAVEAFQEIMRMQA